VPSEEELRSKFQKLAEINGWFRPEKKAWLKQVRGRAHRPPSFADRWAWRRADARAQRIAAGAAALCRSSESARHHVVELCFFGGSREATATVLHSTTTEDAVGRDTVATAEEACRRLERSS
jgi:hypothetical protein